MYATLFDDPGLINRMLPRYLAVTPEAIRDAAAAVFRPDNRLVLTYLPEGFSADDISLPADTSRRRRRGRGGRRMSATLDPARDGPVVADRPRPGAPRPYDFPTVTAGRLANGLSIRIVDLPGRPLVSASMVVTGGAVEEPPERAGATVLAARALTEGTERYDAIALVEAGERLGASLHAEAGWDALTVGVDVPADRLIPALELVAEVLLRPTFPEPEVERLRDERLNDLLQARADPRRRVEEAFVGTIYAPAAPYHRPSGGTRETVEGLTSAHLRDVLDGSWTRPAPRSSSAATWAARRSWPRSSDCSGRGPRWTRRRRPAHSIVDTATSVGRLVRVIHRPGSVQTEIRIGHRGLSRLTPDFHAVSVMSAILGGLFNSRLNMKLREEKGYTYGAGAGFDMRRGAGPFAARAAVNTDVTVPAILDTLAELTRMRDDAGGGVRAGGGPRFPRSASSRCGSRRPARSSARWAAWRSMV